MRVLSPGSSHLLLPTRQAIDLEAVCKARQHGVTVPPSGKKGWWPEARWRYKCSVRPWVLRLAAAAAGGASVVIVWSEATIGSGRNPDLSPLSLMLRSVAAKSEFGEQLLVALPLTYMCACAYFSLLRLGAFSFYHVVSPGRAGRAGAAARLQPVARLRFCCGPTRRLDSLPLPTDYAFLL